MGNLMICRPVHIRYEVVNVMIRKLNLGILTEILLKYWELGVKRYMCTKARNHEYQAPENAVQGLYLKK